MKVQATAGQAPAPPPPPAQHGSSQHAPPPPPPPPSHLASHGVGGSVNHHT